MSERDSAAIIASPPPSPVRDGSIASPYRQCSVSVLDTIDDPHMRFDAEGRCHYFHEYLAAERDHVRVGAEGVMALERSVETITRDGRGKAYDCIMGISGGVDSTYLALLAKRLGLRPLAVHLDNGWNSELAVKNIENIVTRLGIDLHTHVIDWREFRDLQLAYLKASVVDVEALTDHAILATMRRLAARHGIRHILSGTNVVTEQVLPPHWIFNKYDPVNIRAIHRAYGTVPLRTFPLLDWSTKKRQELWWRQRSHSLLNLVPYRKADVKREIQQELGWRDYGGKHYESVFTRFYQGFILPRKFGIDKRKAHLSNLIFSRQITRAEALVELTAPIYEPALLAQDLDFVLKKLELGAAEFEAYLARPPRSHREFDYERSLYERFPALAPFRGAIGGIKRLLTRERAA